MNSRLSLEPGRWYACELIGEEFGRDLRSYTPIKVYRVKPLHRGDRQLELTFYHANYPEGVRDKTYRLRVLERNREFVLMRSEHIPTRFMLVHSISATWLIRHCAARIPEVEDVEKWLERSV